MRRTGGSVSERSKDGEWDKRGQTSKLVMGRPLAWKAGTCASRTGFSLSLLAVSSTFLTQVYCS